MQTRPDQSIHRLHVVGHERTQRLDAHHNMLIENDFLHSCVFLAGFGR
jgi:hypothetical protein